MLSPSNSFPLCPTAKANFNWKALLFTTGFLYIAKEMMEA